jgi:glycosyltransferase involved in cell wall biosynthesis
MTIPLTNEAAAPAHPDPATSAIKCAVAVLTYNEETRLRDCLLSAAWASEVVVVDGYSTDATVSVAREFTDRVLLSDRLGPKNPGGYAEQRNFALEQASEPWVFFLDADERFTPALAQELQRLFATGISDQISAFRVRRKEYYFGVYTPYTHGEAWQTRMVRKGRSRWDNRLVHEGLVVDGEEASLDGYILHYSKDSISDYLTTQNRYTSLEATQAGRDGEPLPRSPWKGMIKTFLNLYIYKGSYREGAFGLIMSILFAQYNFLCWAKRWEIETKAGKLPPAQPRSTVVEFAASILHRIWRAASPGRD